MGNTTAVPALYRRSTGAVEGSLMTNSPIIRRYATLVALGGLAAAAPSAMAVAGPSTQDLRSPDARDAAAGYDPEPVATAAPEPPGEGFDLVSAAIGGAAVGGLVLLLAGSGSVTQVRVVRRAPGEAGARRGGS
jgi:hypothetical protein